jgi:predicted nucleic-acid-binding protein
MTGIDTNLLVRIITLDNDEQASRATRFLDAEQSFIPKTVLLETEWVLRSTYGLQPGIIANSLRGVIGRANTTVEAEDAVTQALAWFEDGMDFADAMHLASIPDDYKFATFDNRLRRKLRAIGRLADL